MSMIRGRLSWRGFTIVELLIVIVIIAILASISLVVYSGIQQRARDAQRISAAHNLESALGMYFVDHGSYPNVCFDEAGNVRNEAGNGLHCEIKYLESALVPGYISSIPDMSGIDYSQRLFYASGSAASGDGFSMYAMAFRNGELYECRVTSPGLEVGDVGYTHFTSGSQPTINPCN